MFSRRTRCQISSPTAACCMAWLLHGVGQWLWWCWQPWSDLLMKEAARKWKIIWQNFRENLNKNRRTQEDGDTNFSMVWESRIAFPFFCMSCKQVATTCFPPLGSRFHLVTSAANEASWHFAHRNRSGLIGTSIQFANIEFWAVLKNFKSQVIQWKLW